MANVCPDPNPCQNGGICNPTLPGDAEPFYCDCPAGFVHPICESRDPCDLEGNAACISGSTCDKVDPFDFICRCRMPYVGEFCESYDLCEVDPGECIEDLIGVPTPPPAASICFPCVVDANCTQVNIQEYMCSCGAGVNHTDCYANNFYKIRNDTTSLLPSPDNSTLHDGWYPIIPTIALTCCGLYLLFLLLVIILFWRRSRSRPKLIVLCDICCDFDYLSHYLISVETGRGWRGGNSSNVYCFLSGENGNAGPFPLNDANLREVNVLRRGQEDSYLVSHDIDLGRIKKLIIIYDDKHQQNENWHCEMITVQNVKTKENWFFLISTRIRPSKSPKAYTFLPASKDSIANRDKVGIDCKHYKYQLIRHHSYISPFVKPTIGRISVGFAELFIGFFCLIWFYGFLSEKDADFTSKAIYVLTIIVMDHGSLAAFICFLVGLFLWATFESTKTGRIPTLLIKREWSMAMSVETITEKTEKKLKNFADKSTNTDPLPPPKLPARRRVKKLKQVRIPVVKSSSKIFHRSTFKVPSTNICRLERWIYENAVGTTGPVELEEESLVHEATTFMDKVPSFSNTDLTKSNATELHQRPIHSSERILEEAHQNKNEPTYQTVEVEVSEEEFVDDRPIKTLGKSKSAPLSIIKMTPSRSKKDLPIERDQHLASGDSLLVTHRTMDKTLEQKIYCELVEMNYPLTSSDDLWTKRLFMLLGWLLCIFIIIASTVICCIYGSRYGYQRTYDWIISAVICLLEGFFLYQLLKVLIIVIIVSCLVDKKKSSNLESQKIKRRFQIYNLDGTDGEVPDTYKLKYVQYLPKDWKPAPQIKPPNDN